MTEPIEVIVQGPDEGEGERLLALLQQGPVPSSDGQDTGATPDEDNEVTVVDPTYWASQPRMVMEVLARTSRLPPQERDEEYWNAVGKKSRQERLTPARKPFTCGFPMEWSGGTPPALPTCGRSTAPRVSPAGSTSQPFST